MAASSVVICGIARECRASLLHLIPQIEALGRQFGDYRVIAVENDSTDGTGELLDQWSQRNTRVRAIRYCNVPGAFQSGTGQGIGWFSRDRITRICHARNRYLEELQALSVDFAAVIDMDLLSFSLDGVIGSFAKKSSWDAVAANGQRYTLRWPLSPKVYWDTFAYEPEAGFPGGVQRQPDIRRAQVTLRKRLQHGQWVGARSAFGGLCLYRAASFADVCYSVLDNADPEISCLCEHVALHRAMAARNRGFRLLIDPGLRVDYESVTATVRRSLRAGIRFRI